MRNALVLLFVGLVLAACGPKNYDYPYEKEPDPRNRELTLGVGDLVEIKVYGQQGIDTDSVIRPDGTITMPLVGDLKAAGRTPSELREMIKAQLANFLKLAAGNEVTVAVKNWKSYRFTLDGEVSKAGVYNPDHYVTVDDAIAMAGGLTRFAKRSDIVLFRSDPKTGQIRQIPLDYDLLASGKRMDMNIYVLPGDRIYVP
ncbi:MAG TPA: polysaccharide biosynthesis/export family protein [Kofleriaceae bacterium]|nr:polysaccharide biosynthesis/export family protein [Kofleriaceae bacterium]